MFCLYVSIWLVEGTVRLTESAIRSSRSSRCDGSEVRFTLTRPMGWESIHLTSGSNPTPFYTLKYKLPESLGMGGLVLWEKRVEWHLKAGAARESPLILV
jgi:hypothetical protein